MKTTHNHPRNRRMLARPSTTSKIENVTWNSSTSVSKISFVREFDECHRKIHSDTNLLSTEYKSNLPPSRDTTANVDSTMCCWPQFEEVLELEHTLDQMPPDRLKQFLFLHEIVNSSSDDSQFADSGNESEENFLEHPSTADGQFYHFHMLEVPIPLSNEYSTYTQEDDPEETINHMLSKPKLTFYSIPLSIKHLLCTHDNLMGLTENITLERIVRRRTLAEVIPMSSEGVRKFFPLRVDFSLKDVESRSFANVRSFIQTLSNKFHRKMGSFFNTTFHFTFTFNHGNFHVKYGIFEDNFDFSLGENVMELHAFSRYLPEDCFGHKNEWKGFRVRREKPSQSTRKVWKSFIPMAEIFNIIDCMLRGKFSWIQNNRRLLGYIAKGGSLRVASRRYDQTVKKNQQRILSNVRKYIRNKELMPLEQARERNIRNEAKLEFQCGLYEQVVGFYQNIGKKLPQLKTKMYVVELKDFETVIVKILERYVYERYEVTANDNTFTYGD